MKKLLTILMALAMIASLTTTAFATDTWTNGTDETNEFSAEVSATYTQTTVDQYKVEVSWGALEFTYTDTPLVWDTETFTWVVDEDSTVVTGWSVDDEGGDIITVTNKSSLPVDVSLVAAEVAYELTYTFTCDEVDVTEAGFELAAATAGVDGEDGSATVAEVVVSLDGTPGSDANSTNSANITVKISA